MASIEEICWSIVRVGVRRRVVVVPEFCVRARTRLGKKSIDIAWLRPREDASKRGSLRKWQIVAAFEIEGYDVPTSRVVKHSQQFRTIQRDEGPFPCYIVLYNEAFNRTNPRWGRPDPSRWVSDRRRVAESNGNIVQVHDGRDLKWLKNMPIEDEPD